MHKPFQVGPDITGKIIRQIEQIKNLARRGGGLSFVTELGFFSRFLVTELGLFWRFLVTKSGLFGKTYHGDPYKFPKPPYHYTANLLQITLDLPCLITSSKESKKENILREIEEKKNISHFKISNNIMSENSKNDLIGLMIEYNRGKILSNRRYMYLIISILIVLFLFLVFLLLYPIFKIPDSFIQNAQRKEAMEYAVGSFVALFIYLVLDRKENIQLSKKMALMEKLETITNMDELKQERMNEVLQEAIIKIATDKDTK